MVRNPRAAGNVVPVYCDRYCQRAFRLAKRPKDGAAYQGLLILARKGNAKARAELKMRYQVTAIWDGRQMVTL